MTTVINVVLNAELNDKITIVSKSLEVSKSELIRDAVKKYIEEIESVKKND